MLLKNFYLVIKITLCQSNVSNNTCHVCTHTWIFTIASDEITI